MKKDSYLPEQFRQRMIQMLGKDHEAFFACYDNAVQKALRLNTRKIAPADYERMGSIFTGCEDPERVSFCPAGFYYGDDVSPGRSPYHFAGAYYIQEPSAMLPATMLDVKSDGQKVLDLCAAPGGKTTQIADLMNQKGLLVANEVVARRASILSENVERMGVSNCLVISMDPLRLADRFPSFFDRILVDAPCSGEGMFRKNPEAVNEWSIENVDMCASRQDMLLDCAADMLAPNGRIVYSTCTFSPQEDEEAVDRFLDRHPEFEICAGPEKIYPHTFKGEGHFAVAFARSLSNNKTISGRNFVQEATGNDTARRLGEWINNGQDPRVLSDIFAGRILKFGDSLYLAPEYVPDTSGIKVLRAGLKIGTYKMNRFEPDHALSHAIDPDTIKNRIDLDPEGNEIKQYLAGMTLTCDREMKGWCIVCAGGFAAGWGKASGGVVRNHYPKGLRTASA